MKYNNIISLDKTICSDIFNDTKEIWEVLPKISEYITKLGRSLDKNHYKEIKENIWIGENVTIDKNSTIIAPCIIDDDTVIRPGAYLRGNTIIGKKCVIGNSCELKNSIIFDEAQIPHFNYVGDSILGYKSHLGAGVIISNLKNDKTNVLVKDGDKVVNSNLRKFGAIVGDHVDVGCNSVIFPGTIIYPETSIYPLVRLRGVIKGKSIVKDETRIIQKEERL